MLESIEKKGPAFKVTFTEGILSYSLVTSFACRISDAESLVRLYNIVHPNCDSAKKASPEKSILEVGSFVFQFTTRFYRVLKKDRSFNLSQSRWCQGAG